MVSFQFKFDLASTNYDAPLGFRCRLNDVEVYTINHVQTEQSVQVEIPDTEDEKIHHISFELFGKTIDDTKVDEQGQILADSLLLLSNIIMILMAVKVQQNLSFMVQWAAMGKPFSNLPPQYSFGCWTIVNDK